MARSRTIHALRGAVLTARVPRPRPRSDGQGPTQTPAAQTPGASPGGGAGTSGAGAPGVSVPAPAAPSPQASQPAAPSAPAPQQQPQPGAGQPGQVQQPGQPANPMAAFQGLPPQAMALVQQWQRAAQWAQQNQHFAALGYQQWQQSQQRGGQPQPAPGPQPAAAPARPQNPFGVPQFDLRTLDLIRRNPETGAYEQDPMAPPGTLQAAQEYQRKLAEATHGFFTNPRQYLEGIVKEIAEQVAQQTHQQQFGAVQQQQFAQQTLRENQDWLFERDAAGNFVTEFDVRTGQPKQRLSAWGQQYAQEVQRLAAAGIHDGRQQHELATRYVQNLAYQIRFQQQQAAAQGQAGNQQVLAAGQAGQLPIPGPGGTQQPAAPVQPPGQNPQRGRQSLRAMLNAAYDANGFTDTNIHGHVMNGVGQQG